MFIFVPGSPGWRHARVRGGEGVGYRASDCAGERLAFEGTSVSDPGLLSETPAGFFEMVVDGVKPQVGSGGDAV